MQTVDLVVLGYLGIVNVIAFLAYGIDKHYAKTDHWRIRERTLILWAAVGGSIGALLGMKVFHHKTLHAKFKYGVPVILILQCVLMIVLIKENVL